MVDRDAHMVDRDAETAPLQLDLLQTFFDLVLLILTTVQGAFNLY